MDGKGIHLKFDNGWTISIQQSEDHRCTIGRSVEIAARDADGNWYHFAHNGPAGDILGYVQPDELASWITYFGSQNLNARLAREAAIAKIKADMGKRYATRRRGRAN